MKQIDGSILDVKEGIIAHQTNCQRVAGAGLALAIARMYPRWYKHFIGVRGSLGHLDLFQQAPKFWIASLYAQDRYGRVGQFTDYASFETCLGMMVMYSKTHAMFKGLPVYFPHGIGCGLAGGDWKIIEPLIERYFPEATIVKLK